MASAEETETDIDRTSDDSEMPPLCQPCRDEGEQRIAVGFCVNCREYLCQRCYDFHRIPSVTKKHMLLENDDMVESSSKHTCHQHRDRVIEYHCPTHSFLGCHLCFYQHQQFCKDVIYIQGVASTTVWSEEVIQFNLKLAHISSKCTKLQKEINDNLQKVKANHTETITAIRDFKQEIIDIVGHLEKELVDKIDKVKEEETTKLNSLSKRVRTILKDTQHLSATIEMLQNKDYTNNLYIEVVQTKDRILRREGQVQNIDCDKRIRQYMFQANQELADIFQSQLGLGSLRLKTTVEKVTHLQDINCKLVKDKSKCLISGLVLLDDQKIIVTDRNHKNTVKIIDMSQNMILSSLTLSSESYCICKITDAQVAVTLPDERTVVFLRTYPALGVDGDIGVKGTPQGIEYLDGKLFVSYISHPNKVEIMDMQGKVINTIENDSNGQPLFGDPYHIAINRRNKLIYVSNWSSHNVICIKSDGTVVATYEDDALKHPTQITFFGSDVVYVCGENSKNVHQLTEDCKKVKIILTCSDGLSAPRSICYEENERRFIIGQYNSNSIKVYKVTYHKL